MRSPNSWDSAEKKHPVLLQNYLSGRSLEILIVEISVDGCDSWGINKKCKIIWAGQNVELLNTSLKWVILGEITCYIESKCISGNINWLLSKVSGICFEHSIVLVFSACGLSSSPWGHSPKMETWKLHQTSEMYHLCQETQQLNRPNNSSGGSRVRLDHNTFDADGHLISYQTLVCFSTPYPTTYFLSRQSTNKSWLTQARHSLS